MAAHELDVYSLTDIAEIQKAYAQIHLHEVHYKLNAQFLRFILQLSRNFTLKISMFSICNCRQRVTLIRQSTVMWLYVW